MGRRNKYETNVLPFLPEITKWYSELTERQIAKRLGVSMASFETYKGQHKELRDALQAGQKTLIEDLKDTLKMKAKGFHYKETKKTIKEQGGQKVKVVEEYERYSIPDTGAIHLLLKNLDKDWRNDDAATMDIKRQKMEIEREKAEAENW